MCWLFYQNLVTSGILLEVLYFEILYYMTVENKVGGGAVIQIGRLSFKPWFSLNSCLTLARWLYHQIPDVFIGKEVIVQVLILYGSE